MAITFRTPPLVELIAELRWLPAGATTSKEDPDNVAMPAALFAPGASDAFFMRFAGLIGAHGFTHSERVIPPGFPAPPYQPIYRYSQSGAKPGATLFQLGTGLFSAHITPPYKRWSDFRPFVEKGVQTLLASREPSEAKAPFTRSLVRYLDCFTDAYTSDAPPRKFLQGALGVRVDLPVAIEGLVPKGKDITPTLQLAIPLENGRTMSLAFGRGKIGNVAGVLMDSGVASTQSLEPNLQAVMAFLDDAHTTVSQCFIEMTKPLHELMGVEH